MDYLALDIGGTKIKYGIIDHIGNIKESYSKDTNAFKGSYYLLNTIEKIINDYIKIKEIKGIGISTAGQVNNNTGEIIFATNAIPGWTGVPLKKIIQDKFQIPCYVDNDVNCVALGEMWVGSAKDKKDFVCLTLGTGIGGAIVINKEVYRGSKGIAGEFGHMTICKGGEKCTCGYNGCFERYASTAALTRRVENKLDGKEIFDKAKKGEKEYINILNEWSYDIALGLRNIIYIINPSFIVIGGGVSAQGEVLTRLITKHLDTITMPSFLEGLRIEVSQCGNNAGMLGAVYGIKMYKDNI
ncbi:MAG: ROK family protein [Epulopiscium sp.]|nr:ROK family protein [Candidatus Epulonipiscium sp.]